MHNITCKHCKMILSNWKGMVVCKKELFPNFVAGVHIFCTPCLQMINENYYGWDQWHKLWDLQDVRKQYDSIFASIDTNTLERESAVFLQQVIRLAEREQKTPPLSTIDGPNDAWKFFGYQHRDEYYYDHFGVTANQWFQKNFEEYVSYYSLFQLVQKLSLSTEGPDVRYFHVTPKEKKEAIIDEWLKNIGCLQEQKKYQAFRETIYQLIHDVFQGTATMELIYKLIRQNIIQHLKTTEDILIDEAAAAKVEAEQIENRKQGVLF